MVCKEAKLARRSELSSSGAQDTVLVASWARQGKSDWNQVGPLVRRRA